MTVRASTHRRWRRRFGRLQVGFHLYVHHYTSGDRWVFQPYLIWDRK